MGMAGYPLQSLPDPLPAEPYVEFVNQKDYGVGVLDFHNATHLEVTFLANDGGARDHVWITRVAEPAVFVV
jgi:hypothetical protein